MLPVEAVETSNLNSEHKSPSIGRQCSIAQIYPSPPSEKRDENIRLSVCTHAPLPVVDEQLSVRRQSSIGFILPATTIPAPYQDESPPSVDQPTTAHQSHQSNHSSVASVAYLGQNNTVNVQRLSLGITEVS
jgi:hypothetical protein